MSRTQPTPLGARSRRGITAHERGSSQDPSAILAGHATVTNLSGGIARMPVCSFGVLARISARMRGRSFLFSQSDTRQPVGRSPALVRGSAVAPDRLQRPVPRGGSNVAVAGAGLSLMRRPSRCAPSTELRALQPSSAQFRTGPVDRMSSALLAARKCRTRSCGSSPAIATTLKTPCARHHRSIREAGAHRLKVTP